MKKTCTLLIAMLVAISAAGCSGNVTQPGTVIAKKQVSEPTEDPEPSEPSVTKEADDAKEPAPEKKPEVESTQPEEDTEELDLADYMEILRDEAEEGQIRYQVNLEKKASSPEVNSTDRGLFVTANGVECRSLEISCIDDIYSFGMELYNDTGSDKTFDQTAFVLEKEEGVYINPFVYEQFRIPETISEADRRLWTAYYIYDPGDLKVGDDVSVYYDGVFITKLTVE